MVGQQLMSPTTHARTQVDSCRISQPHALNDYTSVTRLQRRAALSAASSFLVCTSLIVDQVAADSKRHPDHQLRLMKRSFFAPSSRRNFMAVVVTAYKLIYVSVSEKCSDCVRTNDICICVL